MALTTVILSHNNQATLRRALDSVRFSDHILVIDDQSDDQSLSIAKKAGAQVINHRLNSDFASLRNFALSKVTTAWTLFLDADEVVTFQLAQTIQVAIKQSHIQGYRLKRLDYFLGRTLYHGETGTQTFLRLAKTQSGRWHRPVHEIWRVRGPCANLNQPLIHYPHQSISQFINKTNFYTDIESRLRSSASLPSIVFQTLIFPPAKFIHNYIFRFGYRDGLPGFIMAYLMSLHSLIVRVKTYEQNLPKSG